MRFLSKRPGQLGLLLAAGLMFVSPLARADETTTPTALFEGPLTASKQIMVYPAGTPVEVTGPEQVSEMIHWVPVKIGVQAGFMRVYSLKDHGKEGTDKNVPAIQVALWGAEGFAAIHSDQGYRGNRFTIGVDLGAGGEHRALIGAQVTGFGSDERSNDPGIGNVRRFSTLISGGYYVLPEKLYFKLSAGSQYVDLDGVQSDVSLVNWTYGGSIGGRFALDRYIEIGPELSLDRVPGASIASTYGRSDVSSMTAVSLNLVFAIRLN